MTWNMRDIAGRACDVFEPSHPADPPRVVIYLHGVHQGKLRSHDGFGELFQRHGLACVCPSGARSWWTDRVCSEFHATQSAERHVLDDVLPAIESWYGVRPPNIALFGTSMGGQGALRLAYKHPTTFPVVAGVAPAVDYHLRMERGEDETLWTMYDSSEQARQDTATLHIHPLNWPRHQFFCCDPEDHDWWDGVDRLRMKLYSLGVPHTCDLESSRGGHGFPYYNHMAEKTIAFLVEGLERMARSEP